jgi:hypothetical protein
MQDPSVQLSFWDSRGLSNNGTGASVSNPPSPFVDMVSGAQGTAAN